MKQTPVLSPIVEASAPQIVRELHQRLRALEGPRVAGDSRAEARADAVLSSGCEPLDSLLPTGGFPRGALVEWMSDEASGAGMLAMLAAREASIESANKAIVVFDRRRNFYPPAAAALGVDLETVIVVRARSDSEELWALDQILRCPGVAAVWGPIAKIDPRWFRRLQLAAEQGGGLGLLLRPASVRGRPSWAWAQIAVSPVAVANGVCDALALGRRWRIELIRCRARGMGQEQKHRHGQGPLEVELDRATGVVHLVRGPSRDSETDSLRLAAELARTTANRRAAAS